MRAQADAKKKVKAADDKTFGMKNKNKSKKVQQYIDQVKSAGAVWREAACLSNARAPPICAVALCERDDGNNNDDVKNSVLALFASVLTLTPRTLIHSYNQESRGAEEVGCNESGEGSNKKDDARWRRALSHSRSHDLTLTRRPARAFRKPKNCLRKERPKPMRS